MAMTGVISDAFSRKKRSKIREILNEQNERVSN
jgi:hypothetical protein